MNTLWKNIIKFPTFAISIITGFFLTTFYPIFKLLKQKKNRVLLTIIIILIIWIIYKTLSLMLGVK
uniref:Uncharacterized protein ycf33 n=1 Tax=Leiomenia cribrosa TaxID=217483 RepID=A0A4D6WXQ1_9FLOR|nr:hypothetical protein [Leiomenia cribrosa]